MPTYSEYATLNAKLKADQKYNHRTTLIDVPPTALDGYNDDINTLLLQENTTYIIGAMTISALLIIAIMMGSE